MDPGSLDDYRAHGGYEALARAFELGPEAVIAEVTASKLMGRGGAAFPTGRKWAAVAAQPAQPHYLVCNADESEPGTFKDRVLLEGDPFPVVEAMTIAGFATGARAATSTSAASTRRPRPRIRHAIALGALPPACSGADILGSGFAFDIELRRGAGAYICGEETALFESIEGKRGEPRNKPPFPVEVGLFGKPTVINNVETLANVPLIVRDGGAAFACDRHRGIDRPEALLPVRPRRPAGRLRGRVRGDAARADRARRRGPGRTADQDRSCSAARPACSSGPRRSTRRSPSRGPARSGRRSGRAW